MGNNLGLQIHGSMVVVSLVQRWLEEIKQSHPLKVNSHIFKIKHYWLHLIFMGDYMQLLCESDQLHGKYRYLSLNLEHTVVDNFHEFFFFLLKIMAFFTPKFIFQVVDKMILLDLRS